VRRERDKAMTENHIPFSTTFQANFSCFIGNHAIIVGEEINIQLDNMGLYQTYAEDEEEPIAQLAASDVNKLAGRKIV
jgi:hypothetical protein